MAEFTILDQAAVVVLLVCWFGYGALSRRSLFGRISINTRMAEVRRRWMREMVMRELRMTDAALVGHAINSLTFFASTTVLVIAGVIGVLGAIDPAYALASELKFTVHTSRAFFELKMFVVLASLVFGFFSFTWGLRQYNYICAMIGAAPGRDVDAATRLAFADQVAEAISLAAHSVNNGLRAYYFTIAILGWFVHPLVFMAFSVAVVLILLRRQFISRTAAAVGGLPG